MFPSSAEILLVLFFWTSKHFVRGTFTRVGNTYMKIPDSCCSIVGGQIAKDCDMTSLHATEREQLAYTPGFPNRFPIGRMCMWTIQCQYGYQVRLEFRDFYLIGPGKEGHCSDQYVMVHSPLTGHSMGRFCGNSGIPTIVSAGNLLVVKLYSEIPISSENFRGFVFVFRETLEAPNQEMRPGNWVNHGQFSLNPRGIAKELIKLKPTNVPDPNAPTTTTMKNRITAKVKPPMSGKEESSDTDNSKNKPKKKKPTRPRAPNFARPSGPNNDQNFYGQNQNRDIIVKNDITKDTPLLLPLEIIVAICAGGICALALLILISCKINQVCTRKQRQQEVNAAETSAQTENDQTKSENTNETGINAQPNTLQENSNKDFPLPSYPQAQNLMYPNPNPYLADYGTPPINYPTYCANASTLPHSEKSLGSVSTYLSNTLPPGYATSYGVQYAPQPPPNPANLQGTNNQLLLYDPATGMLFQQPPSSVSGTISTTLRSQHKSEKDSDYTDTSSECSWSSEDSRERRRSKNRRAPKKQSVKKTSSKRKRQPKSNRRRRKRRR